MDIDKTAQKYNMVDSEIFTITQTINKLVIYLGWSFASSVALSFRLRGTQETCEDV